MKKLLVGALVAASFFPFEARAQERAGSAALGAVSGAVGAGTGRCCGRRVYRIRRGTVDRALLGNAANPVAIPRKACNTIPCTATTGGGRGKFAAAGHDFVAPRQERRAASGSGI